MHRIRRRRHPLRALRGIDGRPALHAALIEGAVALHLEAAKRAGRAPGRVLALGANHREAAVLARLPFEEIVLTGICEPGPGVQELCETHPRLRYELANAEALPYASRSFELVLAKEMLHHLPRPVLGLYEMLRVCRDRVVFVEPWRCALVTALEGLGLASRFESDQAGNAGARDNAVFRWQRPMLRALLDAYYLDSGARCEVRTGWLSTRVVTGRSGAVGRALLACGWAASWLPGASGNLATVCIEPGADLPADPHPPR